MQPGLLWNESRGSSFICCSLNRFQIPGALTQTTKTKCDSGIKRRIFKKYNMASKYKPTTSSGTPPKKKKKTMIFSKVGLFKKISKRNFDYIEMLPWPPNIVYLLYAMGIITDIAQIWIYMISLFLVYFLISLQLANVAFAIRKKALPNFISP